MTADCNTIQNEERIHHGGTHQGGRLSDALRPEYIRVDERTPADWVVFARDYAQLLQYYNLQNQAQGDWTPFWSSNPAVVLANLAAAPLDTFREHTRHLFIEMEKIAHTTEDALLREHFNLLWNTIGTLAYELDRHYLALPDDTPLKTSLRNRLQTQLGPALGQWMRWHKAAADGGGGPLFPLVDDGIGTLSAALQGVRVLGSPVVAMRDFYTPSPTALGLSEIWLPEGQTDWMTYANGLSPDTTIFGNTAAMVQVADPIRFALRHYFFTGVFEQFLQAFAAVVREAQGALDHLLHQWNRHEPHFALFLAFLRLLQVEQAHTNTLTDRHLRYYYERVLRLKTQPPQPAQAHIVVELAKQASTALLPVGTALKAGKDADGKPVLFATQSDLVVNRAKVTELRGIFKAPAQVDELQMGDPERPLFLASDRNRYFAASIVHSEDGQGEALTTHDGRWYPFGHRTIVNNRWHIPIPKANIGFALASSYLLMSQGVRTVTITLQGTGIAQALGARFQVALTTPKGWWEQPVNVTRDSETGQHQLVVTLPGDAPAVVPYSEKVHKAGLATEAPVFKATLVHDNAQYGYEALKHIRLNALTLKVGVEGKRDMRVSGSTGPLDVSKPFHPFGMAPETGAVFIVGDKELFQKKARATLHVQWKEYDGYRFYDPHTHGLHPATTATVLAAGQWQSLSGGNIVVHETHGRSTFQFDVDAPSRIATDFLPNEAYQAKSTGGYLKFTLNGDWGHAEHPLALAKYFKEGGTIPDALYDPQLLSLTMDYDAEVTVAGAAIAQNAELAWLHLHPFGYTPARAVGGSVPFLPLVLPQYSMDTPSGMVEQAGKAAGALFIGMEDLEPPQTVSLLVQIADGSADPLLAKPAAHVEWSYLANNQWIPFDTSDISDGTGGLLQSGIVQLAFPKNIHADNTLLPAGKYWVRAGVQSAVDAVGQIIGIHAQAVEVAWIDKGNAPSLLDQPLPPESIGKLAVAVAAIKKITQPYATFHGRGAEASAHFYTRVSERLRHKQRAITQWDYERLVLEAFPRIYQVKCLNHLRYEPGTTQAVYRELAPGHVTLLTIANQQNQPMADPLRPYVSLADLERVHAFLRSIASCFVKLHVRNPQFEPVLLRCKVRFFAGLDETFYRQRLQEEVIQYLSPWAFSPNGQISFGGQFHIAPLINFIEERTYVDYVEDAAFYHLTDPTQRGVAVVSPTRQVSVLVAARQHLIIPIGAVPESKWVESCGCGDVWPSLQVRTVSPTPLNP